MTVHYPIVLERETSGAVSAYVPGLPLYAAANTATKAERAIRNVLAAYLEIHPGTRSRAQLRVARFSDRQRTKVHIVGIAALLGTGRGASKARASRANGRLGGRPHRAARQNNKKIGRSISSSFAVAPMAGMTDSAFRRLVKRHGGCRLRYLERNRMRTSATRSAV